MSKRKTCGKFSQSQEIQTSKSGFERHTRKGGKTNDIQVVLYLTNRVKRTISAGIWSCTSGIVHVNVAASSTTTTTTTKSFMRCDNDFLLQGLRKYFLWSLLPIHHVYLYLYLHLHFFKGVAEGDWRKGGLRMSLHCSLNFKTRRLSRGLKHQRFWATYANRKWAFFSYYMPWRRQICVAKFLCSYRDDLLKNLFKIAAQVCKKSTSGWRASLKNVAA